MTLFKKLFSIINRKSRVSKKPKSKQVFNKDFILEKSEENPIITPDSCHQWESKATFNPAAILSQDKVHLLYRAIGDDDISTLGYASSEDGSHIDERLSYPAYVQSKKGLNLKNNTASWPMSPINYISGGGWNGGCEDPRLTLVNDEVYLIYTAFDGWGSLRIALTHITLKDFLKKEWNWKEPIMISPPGEIHKNWVLFPEKINGKYAILHSICPEILIDYFNDLRFDGQTYIKSYYESTKSRQNSWDNLIRGAGPPPIKTKQGWLLIYHAMDKNDPNKYKLGAMLLDLENPTKILYRTDCPILEPDEWYENEGWKAGVSYCCGAVAKDGILYAYYGGADTVTCVASADLENFLQALMSKKKPKLKPHKYHKRK